MVIAVVVDITVSVIIPPLPVQRQHIECTSDSSRYQCSYNRRGVMGIVVVIAVVGCNMRIRLRHRQLSLLWLLWIVAH